MCGRIAHEWPAYTPAAVAKLPFSHYQALRALFIRAHHVSPHQKAEEEGMKVVDVDKLLGIEEDKHGQS